uniref:Uncharacterized protein n=1 Tax=Ditylenchus dipsaci TaxID=166011 RepID=A0A915EE63_9BILA
MNNKPELKRMQSSGRLTLKPSKKEEYFQCGFQLHVQRAAIIIAAIGICASAIKLVIWRNYSENIVTLIFTVMVMLGHVCMLCAQQVKLNKLYVPYLILNPICVLLLFRFYIFPLIEVVSSIPELKDFSSRQQLTEDTLMLQLAQSIALLELVMFFFAAAVMLWFQVIVYRAFHFMTFAYNRVNKEEVYRSVYFIEPRKRIQRMNTFVA